jgi:hypothetical protein
LPVFRWNATALAATLMALSACGGGEGTSSAPVAVVATPNAAPPVLVTPAPAPAPTPTPTPLATPTPVASPTPTPSPTATTTSYKRVVYVGADVPDLTAYEAWLGRPADGVQMHTGRAGWADWTSSLGWVIDRWKGVDRTFYWSIPLFAQEGNLADASNGLYNDRYKAAAKTLADSYPNAATIYVRTGWEFNADWQPWAAAGKEAAYRGAFRQFVASFRSVSTRFVFEWTPGIGDFGMNPEDAYPGDDVVDIIGMDFYYNHQWDAADPLVAWNYRVTQRYGLTWHQDFAARHGKRTAYAEWGVSSNTDGPFVAAAGKWFADHHVVYASYWNSNAAYPGKLSDDQYPAVSAAYRQIVAN